MPSRSLRAGPLSRRLTTRSPRSTLRATILSRAHVAARISLFTPGASSHSIWKSSIGGSPIEKPVRIARCGVGADRRRPDALG